MDNEKGMKKMEKFILDTSGMEILNSILAMDEYCGIKFTFDFDTFKWFVDELGFEKILDICSPSKKECINQVRDFFERGISLIDAKMVYHLMKPVNIHLYSWYIHTYSCEYIPSFIRDKFPSEEEINRALKQRMKTTINNTLNDLRAVSYLKENKTKVKELQKIYEMNQDEIYNAYISREFNLEIFSLGMKESSYDKFLSEIKDQIYSIKNGKSIGLSDSKIEAEKGKFYRKIRYRVINLLKMIDDTDKFLRPSEAFEVIRFQIKNIGDLCYVLDYRKPVLDESVFQPLADLFDMSLDDLMIGIKIALKRKEKLYERELLKEQKELQRRVEKALA